VVRPSESYAVGPEQTQPKNRQREAIREWNSTDKPDWLNEKYYRETVVKSLKAIAVRAIAASLRVSEPYDA